MDRLLVYKIINLSLPLITLDCVLLFTIKVGLQIYFKITEPATLFAWT